MDVIKTAFCIAIFAAGCALAYRTGYANGATAMSVYYEVMQKTHDDLEDEE